MAETFASLLNTCKTGDVDAVIDCFSGAMQECFAGQAGTAANGDTTAEKQQ